MALGANSGACSGQRLGWGLWKGETSLRLGCFSPGVALGLSWPTLGESGFQKDKCHRWELPSKTRCDRVVQCTMSKWELSQKNNKHKTQPNKGMNAISIIACQISSGSDGRTGAGCMAGVGSFCFFAVTPLFLIHLQLICPTDCLLFYFLNKFGPLREGGRWH